MPKQTKPLKFDSFKGLNNIDHVKDIPKDFLVEANNVDLTDKGKVRKRIGRELVSSGDTHSLFAIDEYLYYIQDGSLIANFTEVLDTGYDSTLHYVELQNKVYFTSITKTGVIQGLTVSEWKPEENKNFLEFDAWEDSSGNSYDSVDYAPDFYTNGPTGQLIAQHAGRIYIASGKSLLFTEPLAPEWFAGASIEFTDRITAVMSVEDGLWVAADALYYFNGKDPSKFQSNKIEQTRTIEGTAKKVAGDRVPIDNVPAGDGWLITTKNGILFLKTSGFVANLSEHAYELPYNTMGNAGFIETGGVNKYITTLNDATPNRAATQDSIAVRVIRNTD